jgi:hypothetical protein
VITCALPNRRASDARAEDVDMNAAPNPNMATAIAAPDQTKAAAVPRIKLSSHGFCLDHPDPALGETAHGGRIGGLPAW